MSERNRFSTVFDRDTNKPILSNVPDEERGMTFAERPRTFRSFIGKSIYILRPDELDDVQRTSSVAMRETDQTVVAAVATLEDSRALPLVAWLESEIGHQAVEALKND